MRAGSTDASGSDAEQEAAARSGGGEGGAPKRLFVVKLGPDRDGREDAAAAEQRSEHRSSRDGPGPGDAEHASGSGEEGAAGNGAQRDASGSAGTTAGAAEEGGPLSVWERKGLKTLCSARNTPRPLPDSHLPARVWGSHKTAECEGACQR